MKNFYSNLLFVTLLFTISLNAQEPEKNVSKYVPWHDSEDFRVYDIVISENFLRSDTKRVVISIDTTPYTKSSQDISNYDIPKEISDETALDFYENNKSSYEFTHNFNLPVEVNLFTKMQEDFIFKQNDGNRTLWRIEKDKNGKEELWYIVGADFFFQSKFPNSSGLISFSRIGFNKERTEALLYAAEYDNVLGAEGAFYLLKKINGLWKQVLKQQLWIS